MIWSFLLASLIIEMTPGPNMAYLAVLSAERGRAAGYAAVAGVALGLALAGVAASAGLSALMTAVPAIYEAIRWLGVAYMLYLAWEAWQGQSEDADPTRNEGSKALFFQRGFIANILNPKAYLFYAAILPEFIDPVRNVPSQLVVLTSLYVLVATAVHAVIVTFVGTPSTLITPGRFSRGISRVFALLLVGVAVWLAFATAR